MKCIMTFSLAICLFCTQSLFGASDSLSIETDSASADKDYWFKFDTEIGIKKFKLSFDDNNYAYLEFQYGRANMRHNDIQNQDFTYLGSLQATIGYFEKNSINRRAPSIVEYDFESLVNLSYNTIGLGAEKGTGRNEYTMWQVDLPERSALGYSLGNGISIMPYYQNSSLYWSGVDTELLIDSVSPIARFQDGVHFRF